MRHRSAVRPPLRTPTRRTVQAKPSRGIFNGYDPGVEAPPLFGDEPIFWFGDVEIEEEPEEDA